MASKNYILTKELAQKKLQRMAYQVLEKNTLENQVILAGIRENGYLIASRMRDLVKEIFPGQVDLVEININKKDPTGVSIPANIDFNDKVVIIVDDVVNSGKTLLYALRPFLAFHPKKIQTLVLVERTHKAFPVLADYVGLSVATTFQDHIFVEAEGEEITGAYMI